MNKEFEGEVKKVRPNPKPGARKPQKDASLTGTKPRGSRDSDKRAQSPLKTPRGTPIVERTPEG